VHERSVDSDFLLIVLREALYVNPTLRVVLMSATLDASLFADYFGNCAVLSIPGRTFPITDFTLEDAIERTGYMARGKRLLHGSQAEVELGALDQATADGAAGGCPDPNADGEVGTEFSERTRQALLRMPAGVVPADLVAALLSHLDERDVAGCGGGSTGGGGGAVLIFLPGVADIRRMTAELARSSFASRWLLLPLHGELPPEQQRRVFGRPPKGVRKVVIATNVAETSLTIDDVRVVIDSGRVKLSQYATLNATAQLVEPYAAHLH
jgi:HrpA-like RNA helicase